MKHWKEVSINTCYGSENIRQQIEALAPDVVKYLQDGRGVYDLDGSFERNAVMFGSKKAKTPGHRFVRNWMTYEIAYAQGLSHYIVLLQERELITDGIEKTLFDEGNINRCLTLFDHACSYGLQEHVMSLSALTRVSVSDNARNRGKFRAEIAPVLERYAMLKTVSSDGDRRTYAAGPFLIHFVENVLGKFVDDGDSEVHHA